MSMRFHEQGTLRTRAMPLHAKKHTTPSLLRAAGGMLEYGPARAWSETPQTHILTHPHTSPDVGSSED